MATTNAVICLDLPAGTKPPLDRCHACALGKMKRCTFQPSTSQSQRIGSLIHSDVCRPMQVASLGGARYYVSFHDDFSGFRAVYFLTRKSEVSDCCKTFFATLHTQTGNLVTALRTDGGTEYQPLEPWMKTKRIRHDTTTRYTPQQNGVSERDNRTIVEGARTLLYSNKAIPLTLLGGSCKLLRLHSKSHSFQDLPYYNPIRSLVPPQTGHIEPSNLWLGILRPCSTRSAKETRCKRPTMHLRRQFRNTEGRPLLGPNDRKNQH